MKIQLNEVQKLQKIAGILNESELPMEEKEIKKHWDFAVYNIEDSPETINKIKTAAQKMGVETDIWEAKGKAILIAISPNNKRSFNIVFKILEKLDLEFDESHGIF